MGLATDRQDRRESGWKTPAFLAACAGLLFTHLAMALYTGGNPLTGEPRYTFVRNFLSDLGLLTTYNNQTQPLVVAPFAVGMAASAYAVLSWYRGSTSKLVRIGSSTAATCLVGLLFLPSDIFLWPHRIVVIIALMGFAVANTLSAWNDGRPKLSYQSVLAAFQISYLLFIFLGPLPTDNRELHVILQKVAIYTQIFLLLTPQKNYLDR